MPKMLPYYRWFPADARGDMRYASMNDMQLGFFHRCLDMSWENGGIPADLDELADSLKVDREYLNTQWAKVGRCFLPHPENPSLLVNRRQEEERAYALTKSEHLRRIGNQNAE